jgi:GntR family transcriptional regulator
MRFRIDRNDERPIYVQIVDEVRSSLILGLLKPGDRLPAVRDLARRLQINLHTVRHAYSVLAEQQIVTVRRGAGTRIRTTLNNEAILDRDHLLRDIAVRSLRTANRHGFEAEELVAALRRAERALTPAAWLSAPDAHAPGDESPAK